MSLDKSQTAVARELYNQFFTEVGQPNPSDINTQEKFDFAQSIGFEKLNLMQKARKESHDFTLLKVFRAAQSQPERDANRATAESGSVGNANSIFG